MTWDQLAAAPIGTRVCPHVLSALNPSKMTHRGLKVRQTRPSMFAAATMAAAAYSANERALASSCLHQHASQPLRLHHHRRM
jgi:hypothetical protein